MLRSKTDGYGRTASVIRFSVLLRAEKGTRNGMIRSFGGRRLTPVGNDAARGRTRERFRSRGIAALARFDYVIVIHHFYVGCLVS